MFSGSSALSNTNKGKINAAFSSNKNWPYDWAEFVEKDTKKDEQKDQNPPLTDNKGTTDEKGEGTPLPDQEKPEDKEDTTDKQPNENFVPIVRTLTVRENKAGTLVFGGRILADGGSEIKKAGIEISQSLRFEKSSRKTAGVKGKKFELEINQLEPGTRYYYRAFARNAVGESPGAKKRFTTPDEDLPDEKLEGKQKEVRDGWKSSEWFGAYRQYGNQWAYHEKLEWVYLPENQKGGTWMWREPDGWLWTSQGTWPFLWRSETASWIYLLPAQGRKPIFYDYGRKEYRKR